MSAAKIGQAREALASGVARKRLSDALDHVAEHGFGDDVDADEAIEMAARALLEMVR